MSLAMHGTLSTSSSSFFSNFRYYKGCSHLEILALIHKKTGVTNSLIQNLTQIRQQAKGQAKMRRLRQELAQARYALIQSQSTVVNQNETKSGSQGFGIRK